MNNNFCYIVVWGNGFVGGFDENFKQLWNGSERHLVSDLQFHGIKRTEMLTPNELDTKRGYHKPTEEEYFGVGKQK